MQKKILVLGGNGNFGKRICESISTIPDIELIIAGRNKQKIKRLSNSLTTANPNLICKDLEIDCFASDFASKLKVIKPFLVIHTAGPFQDQDYSVPKACIVSGSHYIDLADDRRFVCDITSLNDAAKEQNVSIISGASSVPGLSSTVIANFECQFQSLDQIDIAIAPGNKAERGLATLRGILSYTGHPFKVYKNKQWLDVYGWMDSSKQYFGKDIGYRLLANLDVPDLELFVSRYPNVNTVTFKAGLELSFLHYIMVIMAFFTKKGVVKNWAPFSKLIYRISKFFNYFGTDVGGMQIILTGKSIANKKQKVTWTLVAKKGIGPYIPTFSACILAQKLIKGDNLTKGAMPCLNLYSLEEFTNYANPFDIYHNTEIDHG